ncbi:MAG: hypothetical protein IJC59_08275 [Lachnospiraceae bacterium]|nr:hypothetical protein [Lachnospiraceae bacterium]
MIKRKKRFFLLLLITHIFFLSALFFFGVGVYDDSYQYMQMHIHREPGYPFFLWLLRCISSEHYLWMAGFVQSVLSAFCVSRFTECLSESFGLGGISRMIILAFALMPYILTPFFSVNRVMLSSGILSEALCLPLFLLFTATLFRAVIERDKKALITGIFLSLVLSLIRGQMMASFFIWLIVAGVRVLTDGTAHRHTGSEHRPGRWKRLLFLLLMLFLCFGLRSFVIRVYNYNVHRRFIGNTYGAVNTLTNMLYASDREQGEDIEDEELREIFYFLFDKMTEKGYHYTYGGEERARHLEQVHDPLKFEVCEAGLQEYLVTQGITEYLDQNVEADRYAGALMKDLLPGCFLRWFGNYLLLGMRGAVRNVAVVHPLLNLYAYGMGFLAAAGMIWFFIRHPDRGEGWLLLIALLSVAGISFSTALTIMCLSRYMVYGFAPFYTAVYIGILGVGSCLRDNRRQRERLDHTEN